MVPSAWKTWVMPTLRPISPMLIAATRPVPASACARSSHLDLDVDSRREREAHQRIDRLGRWVEDVDEALVRADLELLAAVLVDEGRAEHGELLDPGRERNRADHVGAGPLGGLDDLGRGLVQQAVVVGLQTDT